MCCPCTPVEKKNKIATKLIPLEKVTNFKNNTSVKLLKKVNQSIKNWHTLTKLPSSYGPGSPAVKKICLKSSLIFIES